MTDNQPFTLKTTRGNKVKTGQYVSHLFGEDRIYDVRVTPLSRRNAAGVLNLTKHLAVWLHQTDSQDESLLAGRLYYDGIGRWSIASYNAQSKPSTAQPRGYREQGTIARCTERVIAEHLSAVEYAEHEPVAVTS